MPEPAAARATRGSPPPVVLRRDTEFTGLVLLPGPARIDGRLCGDVVGAGLVWIGETGQVKARIEAGHVVVAGVVEGQVRARECIELLPSARVRGGLHAPRVRLADGCFLEGRCRTDSLDEGAAPGTSAA